MKEPKQLQTTREIPLSELPRQPEQPRERKSPLSQARDWLQHIWKKQYETAGEEDRAQLFAAIDAYWRAHAHESSDEFLPSTDIDFAPMHIGEGIYAPREVIKEYAKMRTIVFRADATFLNTGVEKPVILKCISGLDAAAARDWPVQQDAGKKYSGRQMQRGIVEAAAMHLAAGPYVPKLLDAQFIPHPDNPDQRLFVFAVEIAKGVPLSETMDEKIVDPQILVRALRTTLEGLIDIHSKGVWHHDLKPDHLFFSEDFSAVQFIDFGVSALPQRAKRQKQKIEEKRAITAYAYRLHNERTGTPDFFVKGQDDVRSTEYQDVYAVGKSFREWMKSSGIDKTSSDAVTQFNSIIDQMTQSEIDQRISVTEALAQLNTAFPQG